MYPDYLLSQTCLFTFSAFIIYVFPFVLFLLIRTFVAKINSNEKSINRRTYAYGSIRACLQ